MSAFLSAHVNSTAFLAGLCSSGYISSSSGENFSSRFLQMSRFVQSQSQPCALHHWIQSSMEAIFLATQQYPEIDWLGGKFPYTMTYAHGPHCYELAIRQEHSQSCIDLYLSIRGPAAFSLCSAFEARCSWFDHWQSPTFTPPVNVKGRLCFLGHLTRQLYLYYTKGSQRINIFLVFTSENFFFFFSRSFPDDTDE